MLTGCSDRRWRPSSASRSPRRKREAETKVDLELVLLADASGSIDSTELAFQRQGYANALVHPEVQRAIASGAYRRIALTYVEWGNDQWQDVVVPWTIIDGLPSAQAFGATLLERPRRAHGGNAIGSALAAATRLIEGNDIRGERKVIDLSGDSANSWSGIPIPVARAEALAHGIVINGLAIACRDAGLQRPSHALQPGGCLRARHHRRPGQLRGDRRQLDQLRGRRAQEADPGDLGGSEQKACAWRAAEQR